MVSAGISLKIRSPVGSHTGPSVSLKPSATVSTGPVTMVGASIFTSDVQVLVAEDYGGGFAPAPPPGSTCVMGAAKYTLTVGTKTVDWTRCLVKGTDPYKPVSGSKVLTDAEYKNLSLYLENLTVAAPGSACGTGSQKAD